jgi:hypothetical protein
MLACDVRPMLAWQRRTKLAGQDWVGNIDTHTQSLLYIYMVGMATAEDFSGIDTLALYRD